MVVHSHICSLSAQGKRNGRITPAAKQSLVNTPLFLFNNHEHD
jgi:hypothetical protein